MSQLASTNLTGRVVSPWLRASLLFGGAYNVIGWVILTFSLIFVAAFVCQSEAVTWYKYAMANTPTTGTVLRSWHTGGSEGDVSISALEYTYQVDGKDWTGVAFSKSGVMQAGGQVAVRYARSFPGVSRLVGYRTAEFDAWTIFVLLFPAVGLGLIFVGWRKGRKSVRLLACGEVASARFVRIERTNVEVNDQPIYCATFLYNTADGRQYELQERTGTPDPSWLTHVQASARDIATFTKMKKVPLLGDLLPDTPPGANNTPDEVADEVALYDPMSPQQAMLVRSLPPGVHFTDHAVIGNLAAGIISLIPPALAACGILAMLCWKLG